VAGMSGSGMAGIGLSGTGAAARSMAGGRPARAGAFRLPGHAAEATAAELARSVSPLGLMALQEAEDAASRNRRGAARARDLLRELSALQAGLLGGGSDSAGLQRIASLAEGEAPPDPALADTLAGIALRARVELAKRGM